MKKNMLFVEFCREMKKSRNRFFSIMVIALLGVAFFSGIRAAGPDMRISADTYYDKARMMDIRLMGTLGFTEKDAEELEKIQGIEQVECGYSADVFFNTDTEQRIIHLMSISPSMDNITLKKGRMPETEKECLADEKMLGEGSGLEIGDAVTFTAENRDIGDILATDTFVIVGTCTSPYYLSLERGSSSIGSGEVSNFIMLPEESFTLEAYTTMTARVEGADELLCYSEEYENLVERVQDRIEEKEEELCQFRYEHFKAGYEAKIADAEGKISNVNADLEQAQAEITDAENQLAVSWNEYNKKASELTSAETTLAQKQKQIESGWQQYYKGITEYQTGYTEWTKTKEELPKKETELKETKTKLDEAQKKWDENGGKKLTELKTKLMQTDLKLLNPLLTDEEKTELNKTKETIQKNIETLEKQNEELEKQRKDYEEAEKEWKKGSEELNKKKEELDLSYQSLMDSYSRLEASEKELLQAQTELDNNLVLLNDSRLELTEKEKELAEVKKGFEEESVKANADMAEAESKIAEAEAELGKVEMPSLYIMNRSSIETYVSYGQDADRIEAIGNVFPVIFFLVAALICLTTMTRMVDENRTQIGTLKALGYGNHTIAAKYLAYAFLATFIGGVVGILVGQKFLPVIIIKAYRILYNNLPAVKAPIHLGFSITSLAAAIGCTLLSTIAACYRTTLSVPAVLMRPAAPKSGKRIFLERADGLWSRLNFSNKASFRNLFRYKKRLIMTVLGIGGCTGLLLTGFGLKDSISAIGHLQYGEVCVYDGTVTLDGDRSDDGQKKLTDWLASEDQVDDYLFQHTSATEVISRGMKKTACLIVPEHAEKITDFINFRDRVSDETYKLSDDGVILSEKLANMLDIQEGDTVHLKNGDMGQIAVYVSHITENYFSHYVYMSPKLYENLFGAAPNYDNIFLKMKDTSDAEQDNLRAKLMDLDAVNGITFVTKAAEHMEDMLKSLDRIIYIIVVAAAILAFVVLYNLNNINICERQRELATLKVLGFQDTEVSMYVFRENIWLTLFGSVIGIFIGIVLHRFVIVTAEVDFTMFVRTIEGASYGWSIALTLTFSALVNLVMHYNLTKIDMVESLKSAE